MVTHEKVALFKLTIVLFGLRTKVHLSLFDMHRIDVIRTFMSVLISSIGYTHPREKGWASISRKWSAHYWVVGLFYFPA